MTKRPKPIWNNYIHPVAIQGPASWRDESKMQQAVEAATAALREHPAADHEPKVTIFKALSHFAAFRSRLPVYLLDAIAVALRVEGAVKRRAEARRARQLAGTGFATAPIADQLGVKKRTAQRRKRADIGEATKGDLALYDTLVKQAHVDDRLWWRVALALGLAHERQRTDLPKIRGKTATGIKERVQVGGLTADAVETAVGVAQPEKFRAAARLVGEGRIATPPVEYSARKLAPLVGVSRSTVDRWVKMEMWQRTCRAFEINARVNARALARMSDPNRKRLVVARR